MTPSVMAFPPRRPAGTETSFLTTYLQQALQAHSTGLFLARIAAVGNMAPLIKLFDVDEDGSFDDFLSGFGSNLSHRRCGFWSCVFLLALDDLAVFHDQLT